MTLAGEEKVCILTKMVDEEIWWFSIQKGLSFIAPDDSCKDLFMMGLLRQKEREERRGGGVAGVAGNFFLNLFQFLFFGFYDFDFVQFQSRLKLDL